MGKLFDEYSFKARLTPTFLVLFPIVLAVYAWTENIKFDYKFIGGVAVYCGGTLLMSQLGRDLGRRKQERLYKLWGGKPTTKVLRHRCKTIDPVTLNRYHAKLEKLVGQKFPSREQEITDKKMADVLYESGVKILLEKTRNKNKYALVFRENINYGFRRNLWAMKPAGIFICCISLVASIIPIWIAILHQVTFPTPAILSVVGAIVFLTLWLLRITPEWVRMTADAYAIRLLAACDGL